jgi:hypothetical protein
MQRCERRWSNSSSSSSNSNKPLPRVEGVLVEPLLRRFLLLEEGVEPGKNCVRG